MTQPTLLPGKDTIRGILGTAVIATVITQSCVSATTNTCVLDASENLYHSNGANGAMSPTLATWKTATSRAAITVMAKVPGTTTIEGNRESVRQRSGGLDEKALLTIRRRLPTHQ
jgi:hypothetical protein